MTDMPFYREPFTMRQTHVTNQQPAVPDPQQGGQQLVASYPGQGMPQSTYIQYIKYFIFRHYCEFRTSKKYFHIR